MDKRITDTYAKFGTATNKNSLYDSYIKAFRWSTDRIDENSGGIVAFITNSGWIDANGMDGFRNCLEKEFNSIYIFNLRGAIRGKSKDAVQREGQNVFDIMTGVAITILVKNPNIKTEKATIYYHDIGDYLKRTQKLEILKTFKNVNNSQIEWKILKPNAHNDWLNQRSDLFSSFITFYIENSDNKIFTISSYGLTTNRDAWVYNFSSIKLRNNIQKTILFYKDNLNKNTEQIDKLSISWSRGLKKSLKRKKIEEYDNKKIIEVCVRPYCKEKCYFSRFLNEYVYQQPKLFPTPEYKNICICVSGIGNMRGFSALIVNLIPDLGLNCACQCFPLYYYEKQEGSIGTLFDSGKEQYKRKDGITDFILARCKELYGYKVSKEDIFYYVYGLLHSKDYRTKFMADLKKMLPRIPLVDIPNDFYKYSTAGRELANLHLNYETIPAYKDVKVIGEEKNNFKVEKLSFAKNGKEVDKTTIIYNSAIKITNIPLVAYDYIVNGKSALEWIMDRYQVKVDKDSGIKNDPNDWGLEHNNQRYILDLILSVITVSVETVKIVNNLPKIEFK